MGTNTKEDRPARISNTNFDASSLHEASKFKGSKELDPMRATPLLTIIKIASYLLFELETARSMTRLESCLLIKLEEYEGFESSLWKNGFNISQTKNLN